MVGRSKPGIKMQKSVNAPLTPDSFLVAKIAVLKLKNEELAKSLAEHKVKYAQSIKDMHSTRAKLFNTETENMKLKESLKRIADHSVYAITKMVSASNDITFIAHEARKFAQVRKDTVNCPDASSNVSVTSSTPFKYDSKTQAVKPMVSGHTILNPTITLQRVTTEQLEQLRNISNDRNLNLNTENSESNSETLNEGILNFTSMRSSLPQLEDGIAEDEPISQENGVSNNSQSESLTDDRLHTLYEESETSVTQNENSIPLAISSNSDQMPLMSGIFKDVRVYMYPMTNTSCIPKSRIDGSELQQCSVNNKCVKLCPLPENLSSGLNQSVQKELSASGNHTQTFNITEANSSKESVNSVHVSEERASISSNATILNESTTVGDDKEPCRSHKQKSSPGICRIDKYSFKGIEANKELNDISTIVNTSGDTTRPSDTSGISTNSSRRESASKVVFTRIRDYDPLEGPSTLLNNLTNTIERSSEKIKAMNLLGLSFADNTSTPYSCSDLNNRSRISNSQNYLNDTTSKKQNRSPMKSVTNRKPTPDKFEKVTKRRRYTFVSSPESSPVSPKFTMKKINTEKEYLSQYTNCSVYIPKISNKRLSMYKNLSNCSPEIEVTSQEMNNSIIYTSPKGFSESAATKINAVTGAKRKKSKMKLSPVTEFSPMKRRSTHFKPGVFKEPSLVKKMRRSK